MDILGSIRKIDVKQLKDKFSKTDFQVFRVLANAQVFYSWFSTKGRTILRIWQINKILNTIPPSVKIQR